jgi:hypothetical protein
MAAAALLWAWAVGAVIVLALWPRGRAFRSDAWLVAPLGVLVGMATTSVTYFFASLVSVHAGLFAFVAETVLVGLLLVRLRHAAWSGSQPEQRPARSWIFWLLASVVAQAALVAGVLAIRSYHAEPYGGWDAWAIWNLHARLMLRAGPDWPRLLEAPQLNWTHPDYPRLVPASVARAWAWAGAEAPAVAGWVSAIFAVAMVVLLVAAVTRVRGRLPALLGGLLLLSTPFFATFSTNEHADIPLAAFMLAAVVLATQDTRGFRVLAALCAAFAAWTKNEGLLFVLVFTLTWTVLAWRRGELRLIAEFLGALAVGLMPLIYFKFSLAPTNDLLAAPLAGRIAQIWDGDRHALILSSLWRDLGAFGEWRIAPYLAMAVPFFAWTSRRRLGARESLILSVLGLMLAGYYAVYLLSPQDLAWHIDSSLVRLLLQLWPIALLAWSLTFPCPDPVATRPVSRRLGFAFVAANALVASAIIVALSQQPAANELAFQRGIAAVPDEGWFGIERLDRTTWIWSRGDATLQLHVRTSRQEDVGLRFSLRSLAPRKITIRSDGRVLWQGPVSDREFVRVELSHLTLAAGATTLQFTTDAAGTPESASAGARKLAFAIYDFAIR